MTLSAQFLWKLAAKVDVSLCLLEPPTTQKKTKLNKLKKIIIIREGANRSETDLSNQEIFCPSTREGSQQIERPERHSGLQRRYGAIAHTRRIGLFYDRSCKERKSGIFGGEYHRPYAQAASQSPPGQMGSNVQSYLLLLRAKQIYTSRLHKHSHRWLVLDDSGHEVHNSVHYCRAEGTPSHLLERL